MPSPWMRFASVAMTQVLACAILVYGMSARTLARVQVGEMLGGMMPGCRCVGTPQPSPCPNSWANGNTTPCPTSVYKYDECQFGTTGGLTCQENRHSPKCRDTANPRQCRNKYDMLCQ
jgi:hypothetical protein